MQISIKPIRDWPIYLTASADERLACIMQTSFHSTTPVVLAVLTIA